ncbi:MAG: hypothetical protein Q9187_008645 [Circinaria calcarea]
MASDTVNVCLYDITYALHRLSPLHYAESPTLLSDASLQIHARRFAGRLKGNVLHGVHVKRDMPDRSTKAGPLKQCRWNVLGRKEDQQESQDNTWNTAAQDVLGIQVEIEYEKGTYTALMLENGVSRHDSINRTVHLPLLLTRMPNTLREVLLDYLAITFDTRAEVMRLPNEFIGEALDGYLQTISRNGPGLLLKVVKDLDLTMGFKAPIAPSLRSLDITIKREDILQFLRQGEKSRKIRVPGSNDGRKRKRDSSMEGQGPFMTALYVYLREHLAMDMSHDIVFLSKVSCGAFVLGKEGKAKIQSPVAPFDSANQNDDNASLMLEATTGLLRRLLFEAEGISATLVKYLNMGI